MARYFIDRPVFAMVIAIVIVILGAVAIPQLPIATYPEVVPPVVQVTATYRGGNAQDLESTVAQPIEQQLFGLDGMLYFFSRSSNDGVMTIDVTFELGTNIDTATVQTQNKVSLALPSLPPEVQREGITVKKVSPAFLMGVSIFTDDDRYDPVFLNNYVTINLLDHIGSLPGVGEARLSTRLDYGMRVWVNPDKMATLGITATDVAAAIQAQNRQNAAGTIGQPPIADGTDFQYPVNATGRLLDPEQFKNIVLRAEPDGSLLHLRDVGRVELGAQDYKNYSRFNGKPAAVVLAFLSPGANAVETGKRVRQIFADAEAAFPAGIEVPRRLRLHAVRRCRRQRRGADAVRSDRAGDAGGVRLPAELARHADSAADGAGVDHRHVRAVPAARLLDQHDQHVRAGAGDRHRR